MHLCTCWASSAPRRVCDTNNQRCASKRGLSIVKGVRYSGLGVEALKSKVGGNAASLFPGAGEVLGGEVGSGTVCVLSHRTC